MLTNVGLYHEPQRKRPWLVCWWGPPDADTHRQRKSTKTFRYVRDARAFQAQKRSELTKSGGVDRKQCTVALQQLIDEFKAARLPNLGVSTQGAYENTLRQLVDHFGPTRDIRTIEGRHCETFMANRKRQNGASKPLASWTRARHVINARALFNAGMAWGYVDRNPFSAPRGRGSSPLRVNAKSRPWPHVTPEEFRRLLAVVPNTRQRAAYWLMFGSGLRAGEVYSLTAACIDVERRRIHVVNRAATEDVPPFTIKADGQSTESKERSVPIPEAAIPDITEALVGSFKSGGFVVLSPDRFVMVQRNWRLCRAGKGWANHAHRPWQNRDMMNNLLRDTKTLLRKAGLELSAPFTLHTLRKSFAQNHADAGTPPRTLAKLLGNRVDVCMQYYNRVTDANEREAAATMDRLLKAGPASNRAESAG